MHQPGGDETEVQRVYVNETEEALIFGKQKHARGSQPQRSTWYKPRDDMDKRRSCTNCGSADQHVSDCTTYKQGVKS